MIDSQTFQTQHASAAYTDLNSVQSLRALKDKNQALGEISKQFESMLVRMMLKSMRDANQVFAEGNPLSSNETEFYQNMLDDQLALSLSAGRGIGLAETMQNQLSREPIVSDELSRTDKSFSVPERKRQAPVADPAQAANIVPTKQAAPTRQVKQEQESIELTGDPEQFSRQLFNLAEKAGKTLGVDAETLLAQAALETGWGKKVTSGSSGNSSYNLFNIKADGRWQGSTVSVSTLEYRDGVAVRETAKFRAYSSYEQSFNDYVAFIQNSTRYQSALQANTEQGYVRELAASGYATDPNYAEKIIRLMGSPAIRQAGQPTELAQAVEF